MFSPSNELVNDLLVELHRSLVQYAAEAWPWARSGDQKLAGTVQWLAKRQRDDASLIVELLNSRRHPVDLGMYPLEYGNLHYVDLEFLYAALVDNQTGIVNHLEAAAADVEIDPDAAAVLQQVAVSQRAGLEELHSAEVNSPR